LFSLCVAQEEKIHSSLVQEHGGGGVSSTSFTVIMDMQTLYSVGKQYSWQSSTFGDFTTRPLNGLKGCMVDWR